MRRPFVYPARNLVQFLRAIQPVVLERTLHVLDGIDDVVVHQLVLDADATAAMQLNRIGAHAGSQDAVVRNRGTAALNGRGRWREFHGQSFRCSLPGCQRPMSRIIACFFPRRVLICHQIVMKYIHSQAS